MKTLFAQAQAGENVWEQLFTTIEQILKYPLPAMGSTKLTIGSILMLMVLCGGVVLVQVILKRYFILRLLRRTRLEPAMQYAISKIAGYVILALGFYIALQAINVDLSSLAIIAGAVGVGLGFGLQNVISNFVSGIIILAERPIALGDRVEVGGVAGQVRKISLRSTTVVTNDNITIIVPNAHFIEQTVINWSHGDPKIRFRIPVGVAYGTDIEKLRTALLEVAKNHPKALSDPEPVVFFIGYGDSAINFELAVWTDEMSLKPRRFRSELYYAIEQKLRECKIEIPFPQRDLHLRSGDFVLKQAGDGKKLAPDR